MATRTHELPITIREAMEQDLGEVALIERAVFNDPWSRRSFADLVGNSRVLFLVAEDETTVVGYAVVLVAGVECELANLAVSRLVQRQRVGARLLETAMQQSRERGAETMYLEVRASNGAAIQLYRTARFHAVGRRVRYYARPIEDAIVMKARLE